MYLPSVNKYETNGVSAPDPVSSNRMLLLILVMLIFLWEMFRAAVSRAYGVRLGPVWAIDRVSKKVWLYIWQKLPYKLP